jgi:hypothetical protein
MISPSDIAKAASAALFACWAIFTEFRLQKYQRADEGLKRDLSDKEIEDAANGMSNDDLARQLSKELGGSNSKPKAN